MATSISPAEYKRMKAIRGGARYPLNDAPMTARPRYGKQTVLSHRRNEKRMEKWITHA